MPSIILPDSRKLSYALDAAPTDAPIVLLSNPLCAPLQVWDHVVPAINQKGFRTLRYDQPGHGGSSAPPALDTTFDSMADDVSELLKALKITKLHAWVGVSMGAAEGFYFVTRYPGIVSKFVVCDTIASSPVNAGVEDAFGPRVAAVRQSRTMEKAVQETMERWFGNDFIAANKDEAERMRSIMLSTTIDGFETCCHALRSSSFDLHPLYEKVAGGVDDALFVVGEKDANLPQAMDKMREEVQQGFAAAGKPKQLDLVVIKNAGHVCFIDGKEQFLETVLSFLVN
ncbi:Alpha/Beta hydrolase protein [Stachybotrys elegans]|uniref:Alpha/Beta hydrolase protein n=1 Tax=Stachybotrys elegans TaxID=80388 RepID=A0A8K0SJG7_9HYPO|nr:Alpha/Beta hydrolase protein [Stachybotrys elegans]